MTQTNAEALFYTDNQHKINFLRCIEKFGCLNREYTSTCYIAAYPEIFKCFSLGQQQEGPFDWYFICIETFNSDMNHTREHESTGSTAPLTSQTTALIHLALNLWNGYPFDLAEGLSIWDTELYAVALQAIDLRRNGIRIN